MKTLISWMSKASDFWKGKVNEDGPNHTFHKYFFSHDQHILLNSEKEGDTAFEFLLNTLKRKYPDRTIKARYLGINDVIDLEEVLPKMRTILMEYRNDQIDIFFSPGTSIMQLSWFILHSTLGLNTQLLQLREAKLSKNKLPEQLTLNVEKSVSPLTATIKQIQSEAALGQDDPFITDGLHPCFEKASKVAKAGNVTVLIRGETGTGKEILARYIHANSHRRKHPFVAINCSAFSDNLLESRLFGFKKGAFTDAKSDQEGLFKQADSGIIFLDEIGDISPYMQQSLLRVLQEKEIHPIGGKPQTIEVQVIAATNKDLVSLCEKGKFRWDLYYRLAVAEIEIPSLLERGPKEIEDTLTYFINKKKEEMLAKSVLKFEDDAWQNLIRYHYPGNLREMENLVESLYVFADESIKLSDLPDRIKSKSGNAYLLAEAERSHILWVTNVFNGKKKQASDALGISYNTYKSKLKKYH
jgi:transcriptional regulator with PAS, ATPase and Fis domain